MSNKIWDATNEEISFVYPPDTEYERQLKEILHTLQQDYIKAAEPYIRRLSEAHALKIPQIILLPKKLQNDNDSNG